MSNASKDVKAQFGQRVKSLRNKLGLSQESFAELSGLDRTYISGIERGRRNVSLVNIEIIASALKITISDLMQDL